MGKGSDIMANQLNNARAENFNITHFVVRLIMGALVLAIAAAITPDFVITGFWPLIVATVVLAALDYLAFRVLGVNATPFGKGITGFIMAAVIIYITQFFVAGYAVNMLGSLIGALVYGVIDSFIPGRTM
jgi:uncharacterized membrane protein YvlD (DUF360 family)